MNDQLSEWLKAYTQLGYVPMPLAANHKFPPPAGCYDMTPAQLSNLFNDGKQHNVALATGPMSGFFVIDVDSPEHNKDGTDGLLSLADFAEKHNALDDFKSLFKYRYQRTGTNGWHFFVDLPGGELDKRSGGVRLIPGVDIRCYHQYIVAEPSIVDNKTYSLCTGFDAKTNAPCFPFIRKLVALTKNNDGTNKVKFSMDAACNQNKGEGQGRNQQLTSLVGYMIATDACEKTILQVAMYVNSRFKPPADEKEVARIVQDMWNRYKKPDNNEMFKNRFA